ncbi:MAG: oligosaccharide flippase family protein [Candidatus Omnitrophica bacterium]|nr:oligosaccharide flippase family protein [Candidatus Omnitrophota bacterium]
MIISLLTKSVFKLATFYTGANFINQAIPFFLLPILTRFLSPSDYGIIATFMALIGIVNVIVSMGSTDAVSRGYFDKDKEGFDFSKFIFNAAFINFIVFLIFIIITFFLKSFISQKLFIPHNWLFLLPIISFCYAIYIIPFKLFIFKQKPIPYAIMELSHTFIEIILSIFLVLFTLSWKGRVLGIAINKILFFIIGIYILIKNYSLNLSLNSNYIRKILSYGIPVVFHSLGFTVVGALDRFFLNRMVGLSITGIYSVGYSIATIIGFFAGAFNLSWTPILFEKLSQITEDLKIKLVKFTYFYFVLILLAAFFLIIITPYFLKFFVGKNFYGASQFIFWLALGYAVHGMYTMVVSYIFYEKKTYLLSIIAVITVIINIIFNYTLIKLNGAIGAAQATFLTFLSRFLLVWYFSNRVYPMPWFSFIREEKYDSEK